MTQSKYMHAVGATSLVESINLDKCDPDLGTKIEQHLISLGIDNARRGTYDPEGAMRSLESGIADGMARLGLDMVDDPSMNDTPRRYAKMLVGELTKGLNYDFFPKCTATPTQGINNMVVERNLTVMSLCEHHLQTIDGFAHVAYIPSTKLLGLSKFARVVEFFSRRPQVQERLTAQIYAALSYVLETEDVAVVVVAKHYCMKARGAQQHNSDTITDAMGGRFFSNPALRKELFDAIRA